MSENEQKPLEVEEDKDGSAYVQLPEGEAPVSEAENDENQPENLAEGGPAVDPEREAIREARREERRLKKQLHKEKVKESNHLIDALKKQNDQLAQRLAQVEQRSFGAALSQVDKAIEDAGVQVEYAKLKMKEAVSTQNGDALVRAQEMMMEAQQRKNSLEATKAQAIKQANTPAPIEAPNPMVQRMASEWMERNPWYDPNGGDVESTIAQKLDKKLTEEGFDPGSEDYWDELDDRLKKYLPERASPAYNRTTQRHRSVVTSSGRESIGTTRSTEFRLSPERVAAMKEAGMWEDPAKRAKAIRQYASWDKANRSRN